MIEDLRSQQAQGKSLHLDSITENEEDKTYRLSISGIQKQIETIISLDQVIKDKIAPILHTMQFEDAITQRLDHISRIWKTVIEEKESLENPDDLLMKMSKYATSVDETADYYRLVLKKDPPDESAAKKTITE